MTRVLCLAEDPADSANLEVLLERLGYESRFCTDPEIADRTVAQGGCDVVLAVCRRPQHLGLQLLSRIDPDTSPIPVIILSGEGGVEDAVHAMRSGATDYLPMPVSAEGLALALEHARTTAAIRHDRRELRRKAPTGARHRLVGRSHQMQALRKLIALVAVTDATVLIEGESGTGKELVARSVHEESRRATGPFVTINCAAMPEGLIESTLFGHEKGAFTGATQRQIGAFERADGGTLFLDEISEMRLDLQAKLLRVIQESDFERVGGRQSVRVNVRLIASTNRNLLNEVSAGRFRADLYYRLHVMPVRTPSLRDRPDDIPDLLGHAVELAASEMDVAAPPLPESTIKELAGHEWPGNVRELINATQRAVILAQGGPLMPDHFMVGGVLSPPRAAGALAGGQRGDYQDLPVNLAELEALAIERALELSEGVRSKAAQLLGISERTLRNRLNLPLSA